MARPGPLPKNLAQTNGGSGITEVPHTRYEGSSLDLPDTPGMAWFPQAEAWWEEVRHMPHCILWESTDWLFALETAYMKQDWWGEYFGGTVHSTKSTEIRRREDQMGMTIEARRKLGIRYIDPVEYATKYPERLESPAEDEVADEKPAPDNVTSLTERRKRLSAPQAS